MTLQPLWKDEYGLCIQTTSMTTAPAATDNTGAFRAADSGIDLGKHKLLITNRGANLNPGQEVIDQRKATGQATRYAGAGGEFSQAGQSPTCTLEFDAHAYNLALVFWLFFQAGASEGAATEYVKTFVKYTTGVEEVWASILRRIGTDAGDEHHVITGAIVPTFTLSSDGGPLKCSAEFNGSRWRDDFTFDTFVSVLTDPAIAALVWPDATVELGGDAIYCESFSMTFNNNNMRRRYNSAYAQKGILGDLDVTGELLYPRDSGAAAQDDNQAIDDMIAGTDKTLAIYWGNSPATTDGDLSLILNIRHNEDISVEGDDELMNRAPFTNVDDGTNDISVTLADARQLGIA